MIRYRSKLLICVALLPLGFGGCGKDAPPEVRRARPVTTMVLKREAPARILDVTGVTTPWREAQVGFQVSGPVTRVLDVGVQVRGPIVNDEGEPVDGGEGDIIARVDPERYQLALDLATRSLEAAEKGLEALQVELEQVVPEQVANAEAQRDTAKARIAAAEASRTSAETNLETQAMELSRLEKLLKSRTIAVSEVDAQRNSVASAQGALDTALADLDVARGGLLSAAAAWNEAQAGPILKQRQIEQTEAEIAAIKVRQRQAQTDLEDCMLRAPFGGRITAVHVNRGDLVQAGAHVVTLTLVDPIKISVVVSADEERRIEPGTRAELLAEGLDVAPPGGQSAWAVVSQKGAVADARTRTYLVDLMLRNWRRPEYLVSDSAAEPVTHAQLVPLIERYAGERNGMYAHPSALFEKDGQTMLLRVPAMGGLASNDAESFYREFQPDVVPVRPQDETITLIGHPFVRVEAIAPATIQPWDMLVSRRDIATGKVSDVPMEKYLEHGVIVHRTEWALRPGQLVPVRFRTGRHVEGFYVPVQAILDRDGKHSLFAIDDGVARAVPVRVTSDVFLDSRRVEGEGLVEGMTLALGGVQYLADGVEVQIVSAPVAGESE